jgi:hypothetical protein
VLYIPPIWFPLNWSPWQHLVKCNGCLLLNTRIDKIFLEPKVDKLYYRFSQHWLWWVLACSSGSKSNTSKKQQETETKHSELHAQEQVLMQTMCVLPLVLSKLPSWFYQVLAPYTQFILLAACFLSPSSWWECSLQNISELLLDYSVFHPTWKHTSNLWGTPT